MVGLFLITYEIFFTLYRLCFGSIAKGVWYLVELFISGYFMSDVCVQSRSERPRAARGCELKDRILGACRFAKMFRGSASC